MISLKQLKLESSNVTRMWTVSNTSVCFAHTSRMYQILAYGWQIILEGVVMVTWRIFYFDACNHISEKADVTVAIFLYASIIYKMLALGWQTTPQGRGEGHVTLF